MAADARSYVSGNFALELDGLNCGFLKSIEGGDVTAEVINEAVGQDYFVHKHIGKPKYSDITVSVGFAGTLPLFDWIKASWNANYQRKKGAIHAADHKLVIQSSREFFEALVTETTIPAMDAASKEACYMNVKIAPEYIRQIKGSGAKLPASSLGSAKGEQKMWLPANFVLEIAGLDCTKVNKVDAFTVKQSAVEDPAGEIRDALKEPGKLEFPNLKVTLSERIVESWRAFHEDFVINGNNGQDKEKTGALIFKTSNRQGELGRVEFFNLGIFKLTPDKSEANADSIKRWSAELYCERMDLKYADGKIG
jgi:phage tail-like protein